MPPSRRPGLRPGGMAVVLGASSAVNLTLASGIGPTGTLSLWWSAVGFGVALLALSHPRAWPVLVPAIASVPFLVGLVTDVPLDLCALVAAAHTAEALVAALVLTHGGRRRARLRSVPDLALVLGAGLLVGLIASVAETALRASDLTRVDTRLQLFAEHASSTVLLCAAIIAVAQGLRERPAWPELGLQTALLVTVTALILLPDNTSALSAAPIPLLVWAALRFDLLVVAVELIAFGAAVTVATADGRGPFGQTTATDPTPWDVGSTTHLYLLCASVVTLPLVLVVSQRRTLLDRVRDNEERFRRNFTESPLGMLLLVADGEAGVLRIDEVNASACTILRASADELLGRSLDDVVVSLDSPGSGRRRVLEGVTDGWHGPATALGRPGSRLELAVSLLDRDRRPQVYSAQILDMTQEHHAQRRLEVALKLTDATLDTTACVIIVTDSTGEIVRINAATKEITGYGEADLLGRPIWRTPLAMLDRAETEAMFVWPNRSGVSMIREQACHTAQGGPIRLVWNNNVVHDELGLPAYAVLTGVDVTAERSSTGFTAHLLKAEIATAIIGIDVTGRVTVFNAGASQMLGYEPTEMIGRQFVEVLDPRQLLSRTGAAGGQEAFTCLVGMIGNRDAMAHDWTWRTRSGEDLIVSMTISVTDDAVEDRVGFLCVGRDVTKSREAQRTLEQALEKEQLAVERLQVLDQAKNEFVSTVSHELRTPVTSILGYTEMLRDGSIVEPDPAQHRMLETISRNGERLIAICNDLLLLSGFDSQVGAPSEPVDLRGSVTLTEESVRALLLDRKLDVGFRMPADDALTVIGDRAQLDRVVTNLVSNAIKFTPDGGWIEVAAYRRGMSVVLEVQDSGIGIPSDEHDSVFQRFYRTQTAQNLAIPGTGLGLPIVASIVQAHHGTIGLESVPGHGTTFTVSLPAA